MHENALLYSKHVLCFYKIAEFIFSNEYHDLERLMNCIFEWFVLAERLIQP